MVPEDQFAGENELLSFPEQAKHFEAFLNTAGMDPLPCPFYLNSGVMVASRCHRDLFRPPEKVLKHIPWPEQSHLNARLISGQVPIHFLPSAFNDRSRQGAYLRESFILHYSVMPIEQRIEQAKRDLAEWDKLLRRTTARSSEARQYLA